MTYSLVETIDTRYGTYNSHAFSNGNTLPLTGVPFGMNYFSLQTTDSNGSWWFNPYEPVYQGIRLTHQPSPWLGDFASLIISPVTGRLDHHSLFHRQSSYQLDCAIFRPDLLAIFSNRYQIHSQLTPNLYGACLQCDNQVKQPLSFIFHTKGFFRYRLISDREIEMSIQQRDDQQATDFSMYLSLKADQKITGVAQLMEDKQLPLLEGEGEAIHLRVDFEASHVQLQFATSFLNPQQAQENLQSNLPFEDMKKQATSYWNHLLSRVLIEDPDPRKSDLFYHCLYRCLLFPQTFYEVDKNGLDWHLDPSSNHRRAGKFFTNNGYWDTFRSSYPLLALLYPDYLEEILQGILTHYRDTGFLPKWLSPDERGIMPGTLVDVVIADAVTKGLASDLAEELLEAMIQTSQTDDPSLRYGRHGSTDYNRLGYLPNSYHESVSHSLDYAYSDWAISQVANHLGKQELAQTYLQKSLSYRQLFDTKTGYIRSKDENGQWNSNFSPLAWGKDYAECSAIQATLSPLHDIEGLIEQMGGKTAYTHYLVNLCNQQPLFETQHYGYEIHEMAEMAQAPLGQLAISNQPSFHIPYLFHWSHHPEYTSLLISNIRNQAFSTGFHAYPGDEDNGSLSAWYIFSCLGFYPVCPGKAEYALGLPHFKKIILSLSDQNHLTIITPKAGSAPFLHTASLDGKPIQRLLHKDLIQASELLFDLSLLPPINISSPQDQTGK